MTKAIGRLQVVDALRGFALVSIMLLHNLEHFDYYYTIENVPDWVATLDKGIWRIMFLLFSGKSYAIFALLFGLTFFIQSHNAEIRGQDFRSRFAWRMILLILFGIINSAFFQGDVLAIYAVIGLLLIPLGRLSNGILITIAILSALQPVAWFQLIEGIQNPIKSLPDPASWSYFEQMSNYIPEPSLWNTLYGNLTNGRVGVLYWNWENGRYFLMLSLFLLGLIAGRLHVFGPGDANRIFWTRTMVISSLFFLPFYLFQKNFTMWIETESISRPLYTIISSWTNTSFMLILVGVFYLLFHNHRFQRVLSYFSAFGQMSLTNYVLQSIIGASLYYGFGLALYQHTSPTYGLLIGLGLTLLMGVLCTWWARNFKRGPLETLWHKLTWLSSQK